MTGLNGLSMARGAGACKSDCHAAAHVKLIYFCFHFFFTQEFNVPPPCISFKLTLRFESGQKVLDVNIRFPPNYPGTLIISIPDQNRTKKT